jgi:CxxC-x17-CxxC domain-containing protein
MSFQEKSIQCADCGATFTFTAQEQEFFASKGFTNEPKRCHSCRQARKTDRSGTGSGSYGSGSPRQMFTVTCSECGKDAQVPFEPRGDKPVYCSECYSKVRATR